MVTNVHSTKCADETYHWSECLMKFNKYVSEFTQIFKIFGKDRKKGKHFVGNKIFQELITRFECLE